MIFVHVRRCGARNLGRAVLARFRYWPIRPSDQPQCLAEQPLSDKVLHIYPIPLWSHSCMFPRSVSSNGRFWNKIVFVKPTETFAVHLRKAAAHTHVKGRRRPHPFLFPYAHASGQQPPKKNATNSEQLRPLLSSSGVGDMLVSGSIVVS